MNTHRQRQIGLGLGGFTLIEVLMSILILALGLLGLGAVFPGVIGLQRNAADATLGVAVGNNAAAYVLARPDLNRITASISVQPTGFGVWVMDTGWSVDFEWETTGGEVDPFTGEMRFDPGDPVAIMLADRLWPSASVDGKNPVYVWDIVGRRRADNDGPVPVDFDRVVGHLQVAIFIRRIDPGIRVGAGLTLHKVLTDPSVPSGDKRRPVAVDSASGLPTRNGVGDYGIILALDVVVPARRDQLELNGLESSVVMASQVGQKLVDNLGNVYTVTGVDERSNDIVLISPPWPTWASDQIDQVIFSPQVPSGVTVVDLTIRNPV